jgi:hypothetical protein
MEQGGRDRGVELRLEALAARIRIMRARVERRDGMDKLEGYAMLAQLERRYGKLEARARELQRGNKGLLHLLKCQIEKLSYDVSSAVEDLMMFVDSGYSLGRKSGQER